jgi:hypothetical protein
MRYCDWWQTVQLFAWMSGLMRCCGVEGSPIPEWHTVHSRWVSKTILCTRSKCQKPLRGLSLVDCSWWQLRHGALVGDELITMLATGGTSPCIEKSFSAVRAATRPVIIAGPRKVPSRACLPLMLASPVDTMPKSEGELKAAFQNGVLCGRPIEDSSGWSQRPKFAELRRYVESLPSMS